MTDSPESDDDKRLRRWRLALGGDEDVGLNQRERRIDRALSALYDADNSKRRAGLGGSSPRVSRWLVDIRELFPAPVVQVIQRDAFERLGLKQLLLDPEFLAVMEADVHLVADLIALGRVIPERTKQTAREVIEKVVRELMERLKTRTAEAVRGALDRSRRISRPRYQDIDWLRTIGANLRHYQPEYRSVVPERLIGYARHQRRLSDLDQVLLCVDQSGSMAASVVYASVFAAVLASIPAIRTRLAVFDTTVADLSEQLADPVEVLFGLQLGGGTDINQALAWCQDHIEQPARTHLVLITDLYEGGNEQQMLARAAELLRAGVNLITLLALSDEGHAGYSTATAQRMATLGCPCFACTPDQFPDLMGAALSRRDLADWAAGADIALVRGDA